MITSPIPNQDKLLIWIETLQVFDEGNGIFSIPTIVGHQDKITTIEIQRAIIGLSLLDVLNWDFRFFVPPTPHVPGRVAPQQMTLILSINNELTFRYFCLPGLQFF